MSAPPVTVRSPAKINLGLTVGALGDDGFHRVATVFQAVSLYDEVKARPADVRQRTVVVTGEGSDRVPVDGTNLAVRAAVALAEAFGVDHGVALSIHKTIAVAGGLAGGSTDAAAALVACDTLWGTSASREQLVTIASALGSDVAFCLGGGTAVGTGRGERLSPVLARGSYEWVFAYDAQGLSTPEVYAELDRARGSRARLGAAPAVTEELMAALRTGDPQVVGPALYNELQPAALRLRRSLARTLELGEEYGALGAIVAGSGPTCVFLAADAEHAIDLAVELSASGLCSSVQRATGPVPGARLI